MSRSSRDVSEYFPGLGEDLSRVSWGHGVNSQHSLQASLTGDLMMVEADVSPGHLYGEVSKPLIPIMAHPPNVLSDLSLEMWVDELIKANQQGIKKGAKLDFKSIDVVESSLEILKNRSHQIVFPLWLNADILVGPVESTATPVDSNQFLSLCAEYFPQATLSVGWTTRFTTATDVRGEYTREMVEEMASVLENNGITQPVTFPVRAAFVARSLEALDWLVETVPDSTITVWSSATDDVDPHSLVALRDSVGHDAVYYDLPAEQQESFEAAKQREATSASPRVNILPQHMWVWATGLLALAAAIAAVHLTQ